MSEKLAESALDGDVQSAGPHPRAEHAGFFSTRSFTLLLLVTVCGTGLWVGGLAQQRRKSTNCGLVVDESDLDFGEVWSQPDFEWTLPVSNVTSRDIEIWDIRTSCNCTVIEPKSLVIRAGGSAQVRLKLDLRPRNPDESALPLRDFVVQLFPRVSTPQSTEAVVWEVTGRVRQPVSVSPAKIEFPDVLEGENLPTAQTVHAKCHKLIETMTAQCDERFGAVRVVPSLGNPSEFLIEFIPSSRLQVGTAVFEITLRPKLRNGSELPIVRIPVRWRVLPDLSVTPAELLIGRIAPGDSVTSTRFVRVRSRSGKHISIERVECHSDEITVEEHGIGDANTDLHGKHFKVTVSARGGGAQRTDIRFSVRAGESNQHTAIVVPVSYIVSRLDAIRKREPARGPVSGGHGSKTTAEK